jgi:hypothetical protein
MMGYIMFMQLVAPIHRIGGQLLDKKLSPLKEEVQWLSGDVQQLTWSSGVLVEVWMCKEAGEMFSASFCK